MNQRMTCVFLLCILFLQSESRAAELLEKLKTQPLSTLAANSGVHGDAARGAKIFRRERLGCAKCHERAEGSQQKAIGPDLSRIADQRKPQEIIESIITPNATITEGFQSYVVLTVDRLVVTGVLVSQSASEGVLAVPDKGEVRIPADDIEEMQKGKSAMPADVVQELADEQEFYDLIAYLSSRKASAMGTPLVATDKLIVKEVPLDGQSLPLLAVARPQSKVRESS